MEQAAFDRTIPALPVAGFQGIAMPAARRADRFNDDASPLDGGTGLELVQAILDHVHFGVAVVGAQLRLLFANQAARRECSRHPMLRTEAGHLILVQPRHDSEFRRALAAARSGRWSLVQLKGGEDSIMLAVVPLSSQVDAGGEAPVLVVFGLRSPCKALAIQFYARSCGMTTAEERVLRALSDGSSPREIAHQHEVALSTVRTQLGSIRSKAGACSLTDLMRTLGCLPPIMPAALGGS